MSDYVAMQIARSRAKFSYCKVPDADVARYRRCLGSRQAIGCLGVRNGTECDRFRAAFYGAAVQGVELNPDCQRPDVWIGRFDAMPAAWAGRFDLVFSNAFDHAFDGAATAREWARVLAPGGVLIVADNGDAAGTTAADCNRFTRADLLAWFGAAGLAWWRDDQGHYREVWFRR